MKVPEGKRKRNRKLLWRCYNVPKSEEGNGHSNSQSSKDSDLDELKESHTSYIIIKL